MTDATLTLAPAATKPGWKTSEAWMAFLTALPGAAVTAGLVPQASPLVGVASQVLALASSALYIWSRTKIKTAGSP
jgi:hypothetical protein